MSRKRSRAEGAEGGPLAEQAPLYARNSRGLLRPVSLRGRRSPAGATPLTRAAVIALVVIPLAVLALGVLAVAINTALGH